MPNQNTWTIRLWHIEIFSGREVPVDQSLTFNTAMIVLLEGEADIARNEQVTRMGKGSACFCAGNSTFGIAPHSEAGVSAAVIYFSVYQETCSGNGHALSEAVPEGMLPSGIVGTSGSEERIGLVCRSVYENSRHPDALKRWRAQLDFQELLFAILTEYRQKSRTGKTEALERTRGYMEEHFGEELTIVMLAAMAELSPKYYVELFKKTYGVTAMEYLAQIRMNKAKQLMLGTDRLLKEVAHLVGYRDEFYFSRKFKKEFGVSPSVYMKTRKNKLAVYGSSSILGYLIPLQITPYAAPLHPKWSRDYHQALAPVMPVHLSAFRQNHNKHENLQNLADAEPELIIITAETEGWEKERLERIAPLYEMKDGAIGWRAQLLDLAKLLGKEKEAASWLAEFERTRAEATRRIRGAINGRHVVLPLRLYSDRLHINEGRGIGETLFDTLGFEPSPILAEQAAAQSGSLTLERIAEYGEAGADHIFMLVRQDSETLGYWKAMQASPEWLRIPSVRAGRVHLLPSYPWREYSPFAISRMLEELPAFFSGNNP
ncbi:AraC family transcriptional regulator [Paenibacillus sp. M1]|uniref:AraC family transcriptional regulator n=1 Tax=Paenibacillus haidiansis TaxID=1574488 RepID=A0ABU7VTK9_9BACL